jgi:hypothetical protein
VGLKILPGTFVRSGKLLPSGIGASNDNLVLESIAADRFVAVRWLPSEFENICEESDFTAEC